MTLLISYHPGCRRGLVRPRINLRYWQTVSVGQSSLSKGDSADLLSGPFLPQSAEIVHEHCQYTHLDFSWTILHEASHRKMLESLGHVLDVINSTTDRKAKATIPHKQGYAGESSGDTVGFSGRALRCPQKATCTVLARHNVLHESSDRLYWPFQLHSSSSWRQLGCTCSTRH